MWWRRLSLLVVLIGVGIWPAASVAEAPVARAAATCADYATQASAQRAADTRDPDGDGIYCESLPCPCASADGDRGATAGGEARKARKAREPRRQTIAGRVTDVVDGDTLAVRARGGSRKEYRVRLIGI